MTNVSLPANDGFFNSMSTNGIAAALASRAAAVPRAPMIPAGLKPANGHDKAVPMFRDIARTVLPIEFQGREIVLEAHAYEDDSASYQAMAVVHRSENIREEVPLVRLHSGCVTGDIFHSLRCDCYAQLQLSLERVVNAATGVIIYLPYHEGRGIGLVNKIKAYAEQDRGLDTVDANLSIGAPVDARDYELAAKMQLSAAAVTELSGETASTLALYGADDTENTTKARFAQNCILARRLIEKGVRFVQLFNGAYAMGEGVGNWDGHKTLVDQYSVHGPILDQPVAGLLRDLKDRGLLAETLVAFVTEFGRMPTFQKGASGRDHNPAGFTVWLAGAGVKRAFHYGATDEFGYKAVENVATIYDLHATILHLLGIDHTRLTYYNNGIERRLTDVHGHVIEPILA